MLPTLVQIRVGFFLTLCSNISGYICNDQPPPKNIIVNVPVLIELHKAYCNLLWPVDMAQPDKKKKHIIWLNIIRKINCILNQLYGNKNRNMINKLNCLTCNSYKIYGRNLSYTGVQCKRGVKCHSVALACSLLSKMPPLSKKGVVPALDRLWLKCNNKFVIKM